MFGRAAQAGGVDADTGASAKMRLVRTESSMASVSRERGGILQNPVGFRLIVDEQLAIVIQDLVKNTGLRKGRRWQWKQRQRSVPGWSRPLVDATQGSCCVHIGIGQGG